MNLNIVSQTRNPVQTPPRLKSKIFRPVWRPETSSLTRDETRRIVMEVMG